MIIENSKFARILNVNDIVLFPFIFISHDEKHFGKVRYQTLLNHSKTHYVQQKELLVIFFVVLLVLNYMLNLFAHFFNGKLAYKNIVFEREAITNEKDIFYLKNRKFWNFRKYFFSKTIR